MAPYNRAPGSAKRFQAGFAAISGLCYVASKAAAEVVLAFARTPLPEAQMPIVPNTDAEEIPWRPGYRNFVLAGRDQGLACIAGYSVIEPGAGAPLHSHKDVDEIFILLEGTLDLRLGDEQRLVEANHTIAIPAGVPHAFVAVGPNPVRMFTFMPRNRAIADATTYYEGAPPAGADRH